MNVLVPSDPRAPAASSLAVQAVMKGNRGRDTRPEVLIRSRLHAAGLRFRKHASPLPGLRCSADVVFPRRRVAVFVDGCFWHGCPDHGRMPNTNSAFWSAKVERNRARDRRNDAALAEAGWSVVRIWEHEDPESAVARIVAALGRDA